MCSKATGFKRGIAGARRDSRGVTLVELIAVLLLLAIIAAVAGMAVREPVQAYVDTSRRAELTEMADGALRRMARDLRRALPNSPRVIAGNPTFLEVLLTRTGGRYRAQDAVGTNLLDFNVPDNAFDSLGALSALPGQAPQAGDVLVVYNLFPTGTQANAYTYNQGNCTLGTPFHADCNSTTIIGVTPGVNSTNLQFFNRQFPLRSPGNRFYVVEGPVSYVCTPAIDPATGDGAGTLRRVSNYAININQPAGGFPGGVQALMAENVIGCEFTYNPNVLTQTMGLISLQLELRRGGETVRLYHEVHVSNVP